MKRKVDILILGAGIAGYEAFRSLSKRFRRAGIKKKILLVDKNNYFTFTPMLHEVASGSVQAHQCAIPVREVLYKSGHDFLQGKVKKILPEKKLVKLDVAQIEYEYCIVALGSRTNYFGNESARENAENVRSLPAAIRVHQKFIRLLEEKESSRVNLVIVGGGPTGVELAGQFIHLANHDLKALYPDEKVSVTLIQAMPNLLPFSPEKVRNYVETELKKDGVRILLDKKVKEVKQKQIVFEEGDKMDADLVIWATGFRNTGADFLSEKYCKKGLVEVDDYLQSKKEKSLFALGDIAFVENRKKGEPYPKLGEIAQKQGNLVARNLVAEILGKEKKPFEYQTRGELIPLGDWFAVAHIGPVIFKGMFAWWLRRTVYLLYIPGFWRKFRIVMDWTLHSIGFKHIVDLDMSEVCED